MASQHQQILLNLLDAYRHYLVSKVSKVRILGDSVERELKDVFVELSIVTQRAPQQDSELLGMMDFEMRRRFNPFLESNRAKSPEFSRESKTERKRFVKPDELLRRRTNAIITGAPGCGKTTLLKYLALQAQEKENRLVLWLELKAIGKPLFAQAEKAAAQTGSLILQELWLKHLKSQLTLSNMEIRIWRDHWREQFRANKIVVLLDGFDEVQDEAIERRLNKSVAEFASTLHENALLISTRPYARHKLGKERLQELEIEPLNQLQIEAFLNCYYPSDLATRSLLKTLRERTSLRELVQVPLLLGIILRLYRENRFIDKRLELYESIVADLIHELDRSKSVVRQFRIKDERVRLDFLQFLAFERLLRDRLREDEQEVNRIAFNYRLLREKAEKFLAQERSSYDARLLVNDALATPLLREVATDTFAFTHLTLQEYLAAQAFVAFYRRDPREGLNIFFRAYHNSTTVEMEVLAMMLGAISDADMFYAEIARWPDSLTFTNLRLQARGLAYNAKAKEERTTSIVCRLLEFIQRKRSGDVPYREIVINSFVGINNQIKALLETKAESLVEVDARYFFTTACALAQLGSEGAIQVLITIMRDRYHNMRQTAAYVLGQIGSDDAIDSLISALQHNDMRDSASFALSIIKSDKAERSLILALKHEYFSVRAQAVEALGAIGTARAVRALTAVLEDEDENREIRQGVLRALGQIGSDTAVEALITVLRNGDRVLRALAAEALAKIRAVQSVEVLILSLNDDSAQVRKWAVESLGRIGSERAVETLMKALDDDDYAVRQTAIHALGQIGSDKGVEALIVLLNDQDGNFQKSAVAALGEIGSAKAVRALTLALQSPDSSIRESAAEALGETNSDECIEPLISMLRDADVSVRQTAASSLGEMGSEKAVRPLVLALHDIDAEVRRRVAAALGEIGSEKAVSALISIMQDENIDVRQSAIRSLGKIGSANAVDILLSVLREGDGNLKWLAIIALGSIGSERAVKDLIAASRGEKFYERRYAIKALGEIGSAKAVGALIRALADDDINVCEDAAEALSGMKAEALLTGLKQCLKRRDAFLRMTAVSVLGYYSNDRQMLNRLWRLAKEDEDSIVREAATEAADKFTRKLELLGCLSPEGPALGDNESRELFLVGETFRVAAEAGHIFRPTPNSDWGIDGEIEFKNDAGEASGRRVYLQLKSGDSHLRKRKRDGKEIFAIKARHAIYWQSHAYPVLLVIRDSAGRIRWMNVTEYLQRHGTSLRQIEFEGEPFTAESVNQMGSRIAH